MRRMTVVLLFVFVLAAVFGAAAPASAKNRHDRGDRFMGYRCGYPATCGRGGFYGQWRDPYVYRGAYRGNALGYPGYGRAPYGYRYPRAIYVPGDIFYAYPAYVTVVRPVIYEDVVLVPGYRYRVIERHRDRFVLIFGTGSLTVILRG